MSDQFDGSDQQPYAPPTTPPAVDAPPPPPTTPVPGTSEYAHRYPTAGRLASEADNAVEPTVETTATIPTPPPFPPSSQTQGDQTQGDQTQSTTADRRSSRGIFRTMVAGVAIIALAGAAGYGGSWLQDRNDDSSAGSLTSTTKVNAKLPDGEIEKVAATVLPSVVQINVRGQDEGGSGTGIIISDDGDILTNNHVVRAARDSGTVTVVFTDGAHSSAEIVGTDPVTDLAVIRVEGRTGLQPAELGSSSDLQVGQQVVAIGSPYGLESSVTYGIVSALNRPVTSSDGGDRASSTTFPAIQTDAAINPGNSGGPLVNLAGQVVGINAACRGESTGISESCSSGLGFAIPVDLAKNVANQLLAGQKVEHARVGVTVGAAVFDDDMTGIGAQVKEVTPGSAADEAGLKVDDVITAVDGNPVANQQALVASILAYKPGEKVTLTVQRGTETLQVEVTLGSDADTA